MVKVSKSEPNIPPPSYKESQKRKDHETQNEPRGEETDTEFMRKVKAATGIQLYGEGLSAKGDEKKLLIFDAWERPYYISLMVTSVAVLYTVFFVSARGFFTEFEFLPGIMFLWHILDTLADIAYISDSFVQSRTGYLKNGILMCEKWGMCMHYLRSPYFLLDVLSILPTDILYFGHFVEVNSLGMVRLNRLLRFHRLLEFLDRTWRISSKPNLTRGATLTLYIFIIVHFNSCAYYKVSEVIGFESDSWVLNKTKHSTVWGQYLRCTYWVVQTFTTGESFAIYPHNYTETLFVIANILISILVIATLIGNISTLVQEYSAKRTSFHNWYDKAREYMKEQNIDLELQERVCAWFEHYWLDNAAVGGSEDDLNSLPEHLKAEINMNAHLETLKRVKIFQDCEPGLLLALVNKLRLVMFNPRECICLKGDVGKEMYIVKSGKLSVVSAEGVLLVTLGAGASFGELALLNIVGTTTGNRRTATVISQGYSYLFVLTKEDLWLVLQDFPEAKKVFTQKGREILLKDGLLDEKSGKRQYTTDEIADKLADKGDKIAFKMAVTLVGLASHHEAITARTKALEAELEEMEETLHPVDPSYRHGQK